MTAQKTKKLEADLAELLEKEFPGMDVIVEHSERWGRMCVTFRWGGFRDLLPEERFRRLIAHIPESFRDERMAGFVWLELADNESVDEFLKLPRSEDIGDRERKIYSALIQADLFKSLRAKMRPNPSKSCKGDFSFVQRVLQEKKQSSGKICDAKLLFMRYGAYCDCQVIDTVEAQLSEKNGIG